MDAEEAKKDYTAKRSECNRFAGDDKVDEPLTEDRRKDLVKLARKYGEDTKTSKLLALFIFCNNLNILMPQQHTQK